MDLKASLTDVIARIDGIGVDMATLIAKLQTGPTDLTEVIALAKSIQEKIKAPAA